MERRLLHLSLLADPLSPFSGGMVGGRQVLVREAVRAVQSEGFGIDVLTAAGAGTEERSALGHLARVVRLRTVPAGAPMDEAALAWGREAWDWIRSQRRHYQLMHSHHWMSGAVAAALRSDLGVPWVHSPWSMPDFDAQEPAMADAMRAQLASADWIVMPYPAFADRVAALVPGIRVRVISPGVDMATFFPRDPGPMLKTLGQTQRGVLTVVGEADDGVHALLEEWVRRHESGAIPRDVLLMVAGMDAPAASAADWAARGVRFLGTLPHRSLARYYSAAAATVLPARHASLGMAALESMASGTPVVATEVAGQASVVLTGETGRLVAPLETGALLDAALEIQSQPALARRMSGAAVEHIRAHYARERMAKTLADLYQEVAGVPSLAAPS